MVCRQKKSVFFSRVLSVCSRAKPTFFPLTIKITKLTFYSQFPTILGLADLSEPIVLWSKHLITLIGSLETIDWIDNWEQILDCRPLVFFLHQTERILFVKTVIRLWDHLRRYKLVCKLLTTGTHRLKIVRFSMECEMWVYDTHLIVIIFDYRIIF